MNAPFLLRCTRCLELVDPAEGWQVRAHVGACGHDRFAPVPIDTVTGRAREDADAGVAFTSAPQRIQDDDHRGLDRLRALQQRRLSHR